MNEQVETGILLVVAAADEKGNIVSGDLELRRGECSRRRIPINFAAGHLIVARVFNLQLWEKAIRGGSRIESRAGRDPIAVVCGGEVSYDQIVCATVDKETQERDQNQDVISGHGTRIPWGRG
jgi:hypothetical protein